MKKVLFVLFLLILLSLYGCNDSLKIYRISASSLSEDCLEELNSEGAFLINSNNQQIIVFTEKKQSIKDIRYNKNGNDVNVYYYTKEPDKNNKHIAIYKEALKIENKEHINTINVFLNDKPSFFEKNIIL